MADVLEWTLAQQGPDTGSEEGYPRLRALLDQGFAHVQLVGAEGLRASIPLHKLLGGGRGGGDVLLAHTMNGEPLPPQHGYPLRLVVPGVVGVRNVKWLTEVQISREEAEGAWQRGIAYKGFGPSVTDLGGVDVEGVPSVQETPVQSAITEPAPRSTLSPGVHTVRGYAYSGGGRGIVRVDVSADGGQTWHTARLLDGAHQPLHRAWAWTLWECDLDLAAASASTNAASGTSTDRSADRNRQCVQLVCRATDASYNVQPDSVAGVWNIRGILNNAWHRVTVTVEEEEE